MLVTCVFAIQSQRITRLARPQCVEEVRTCGKIVLRKGAVGESVLRKDEYVSRKGEGRT